MRRRYEVVRRLCILFVLSCWVGCAAHRPPAPKTVEGAPAASQPATQPAADPWAGREDLIRRPALKPTGALRLPKRQSFELPNGLSVLVVADSTLPLVEVGLHIRVGSIDEPPERTGLAEFTADMLRQGVRGMTADQISRTIDAEGASLDTSSGYELSQIGCSGRSQSLKLCLDLVAKLASQPTFPPREMIEVRQRLLADVRQLRDNPHALAAEHFHNLLYGDDHPAGRPLTAASVGSITHAEVVRFHRERYLPGATVLVVTGDLDAKRIRALVSRRFARWRARKPRSRWVRAVKGPERGFRLLLVDKPDLSQSFFALGHAGVSLRHPDRDALRVVNFVLGGGGFSSRLMKTVRSRGGKTYGISSSFSANQDDGHFVVSSFTRNDQIVATLKLVREELARIRSEPPSEAEISAAKGKIAGGFALRFPTPGDLAGALARSQLRGLPESYVSELPLRVERLEAAEIARAARAHVRPESIVGAVVGKAEVVAPLLTQAKIAFSTISYEDPIGARARLKQQAAAPSPGKKQ